MELAEPAVSHQDLRFAETLAVDVNFVGLMVIAGAPFVASMARASAEQTAHCTHR
jgi:hypothetical protein